MIDFGSIFRHKDDYYVYLVRTDDLIYAAKILDRETTRDLVRSRDVKSRNPKNKTTEKTIYCFVVLSTEDFKDQAAHYGIPGMSNDVQIEEISMLNDEDLELLKDEVLNDGAVTSHLKELVSGLFGPQKQ